MASSTVLLDEIFASVMDSSGVICVESVVPLRAKTLTTPTGMAEVKVTVVPAKIH